VFTNALCNNELPHLFATVLISLFEWTLTPFFLSSLSSSLSLKIKMKYLSTLREKGHVQVGHQRQSAPIKLYYEMHGTGPERVLLVMGKYLLFISTHNLNKGTNNSRINRIKYTMQCLGYAGTLQISYFFYSRLTI
jgi:hypothetical protein